MKGIYVCPSCGSFVNLEDEICQECDEDITLYDEIELESDVVPVVVYTAETLSEAQALVEFLRNNDISAAFVDFDSPARELLKDTSSDSVLVVTLAQNASKAEELVDDFLAFISDETEDDEEKDWSIDDDFDIDDDDELGNSVGTNQIA